MVNILSIDFDWVLSSNQWLELNNFILNKVDKAKTIGFIKQHHHILHYLDSESHVTNIDHHHDIFYDKKYNKVITEGNWVAPCIRNKKIVSYEWIGNTKSSFKESELAIAQALKYWNYGISLEEIKTDVFDTIIFVESFGYRHEHKTQETADFFVPWRITKQFLEKYHPEKIKTPKIEHITKYFNNND